MVSTPNAPNGLFDKIEREPEESCIYKRVKLDYIYGIGKIYTKEEIDKAMRSPSFGREYDLQYLGLIGNKFHTADIERAHTVRQEVQNNKHLCTEGNGYRPRLWFFTLWHCYYTIL